MTAKLNIEESCTYRRRKRNNAEKSKRLGRSFLRLSKFVLSSLSLSGNCQKECMV